MIRTIAQDPATEYVFIALDADGNERTVNAGDRPASDDVIERAVRGECTDVLVWSHGWKGDVPAALDQYDRWIGRFAERARAGGAALGRFKPLYIGLHWPSLPFGDEALPGAPADAEIRSFAATLGGGEAVARSVRTVIEESRAAQPDIERVANAYRSMEGALDVVAKGAGGDPGSDRAPIDYSDLEEAPVAFGLSDKLTGGLLGPLRQLSFWRMKRRAQSIGEGYLRTLINRIQGASQANVHLIGHSFGTAVVMSALIGRERRAPVKPVASVSLLQGAISLWSFASEIPAGDREPGYLAPVVADRRVSGPLVCTTSAGDTAVGRLYPWAAGVANQVAFDPGKLPVFGAIGTFGIRGVDGVNDIAMGAAGNAYSLAKGAIYNVESSAYISKMDGISGSHNDVDGPEVANLVWHAMVSGRG